MNDFHLKSEMEIDRFFIREGNSVSKLRQIYFRLKSETKILSLIVDLLKKKSIRLKNSKSLYLLKLSRFFL